MAIEIVDLPINSMVIFHGNMLVHQRVVIFFYEAGVHKFLRPRLIHKFQTPALYTVYIIVYIIVYIVVYIHT